MDVAADGSVLFGGDCYMNEQAGQVKVVMSDVESNVLTNG